LEAHSVNFRCSPLVLTTCAILLLHGSLLAVTIADYRVTIDSAYHVSMGRCYGEHGLVPWDYVNFGPRGRPNLQGPLLHGAIGGLGRLLGGRGDDYVRANAILAVIQWAAAMGTAAFFAFWLGGELAMLLAVALLSGAAFAAASFTVGIPSGWLFIFTPWAIWFVLKDRLVLAAVAAALAIYSHIGGYLTAPLGIVIAAICARRWQQLLKCGALVAALTLPYTIHIVRYAGWLSGVQSHSALLFDPMLDVLAIAGAVSLMRTPRRHRFMVAWLLAPIPWLFEDPGRFLLQWPLGGSVAAGWLLANGLARFAQTPYQNRYVIGLAAVATFAPFGVPSVAAEVSWAVGNHYPLAVDWNSARSIARSIDRARPADTLISDYSPALCPALAAYTNIACEKGHWVEVQPRTDPADYIPAARKTYVLPLASGDPTLASLRSAGWVTVYPPDPASGLSAASSVVRLTRRPSIREAAVFSSATIAAAAAWLGRNMINNALSFKNMLRISSAPGREQFRRALAIQRKRAGDIEVACVVYAWALEPIDPQDARTMRQIALKTGVLASYLSDDYALDFLSAKHISELKEQFRVLAIRSSRLAFDPSPSPELINNFNSLLSTAVKSRGNMFAGRPAGNWLPWLFG
jgi:hypothetical protein